MRARLVAAGAVVLLLAAWWLARTERSATSATPTATAQVAPAVPASTAPASVHSSSPVAVAVAATTAPAAAPPPPARSLRCTEVDGAFEHDGSGRFIATTRALQLFDYFNTTEGEQDAATIRAHVDTVARQQLPEAEAQRALALYDRYQAYRHALQRALADAPTGAGARVALDIARATRPDFFDADEANRLFSADDARAEAILARAEHP